MYVVLVTGSRELQQLPSLAVRLRELRELYGHRLVVVHGDSRGADTIADVLAEELGIVRIKYPANWEGFGRKAGPLRNGFMLSHAKPDLVLAFPSGSSRGTRGMMQLAADAGVRIEQPASVQGAASP